MNIVHYLRDFGLGPNNAAAGLEKAVAGLSAGIVAADPSVKCTVLCEGAQTSAVDRPEGFRVLSFDHSTTKNRRFAISPTLRDFVQNKLQANLVVLHAIFNPNVFLMSRLLRRRGIPYIVAPHDPYHPAMFTSGRLKKAIYWRLCEGPLLRRAAAVQVLDRRHENYLRDRGINTPVIEIGNGYSSDDVPDESQLSWSGDSAIRLLFLGRLDPVNKGLDLLIDAMAGIKNSNVQLTLQGPDRGEANILRDLIKKHAMRNCVKILPPDFQTRSPDLAAKHDLFILPSRFEGFGLSALEAMLAARPVIVSDIAGLAPHVRKCGGGVVVDSTVESIRSGIEQIISRRSEWRDIGLRGRRYVLENLGWRTIGQSAIERYRAIASSSKS